MTKEGQIAKNNISDMAKFMMKYCVADVSLIEKHITEMTNKLATMPMHAIKGHIIVNRRRLCGGAIGSSISSMPPDKLRFKIEYDRLWVLIMYSAIDSFIEVIIVIPLFQF